MAGNLPHEPALGAVLDADLAVPFGLGPVGIWLGFGIGLSLAGVALVLRFRTRTRGQGGGIVSQTVSSLR